MLYKQTSIVKQQTLTDILIMPSLRLQKANHRVWRGYLNKKKNFLWDWKLKNILYKNSYPRSLVEKCIKCFLDKILAPKSVVSTVPKKDLVIVLPQKMPFETWTRINRIMKNKLPFCNSLVFFQTKCKLSNFFTFKNKIPSFVRMALFTNFGVVAAMLPITAILNVILRSECVNIWGKFWHLLRKN